MSTVLEKAVLLDETGQLIVDKLDDIKEAIGNSGEYIPLAIRVTTPPTKVSYYDGDALDLSGIVVSLVGSNGSLIDVTSACTFSPANGATLSTSDTSVAITYHYDKDNVDFTASQSLTVTPVVATSIAVTTPPTKTEYMVGETLDLTDIVVTATYNNGTTADVTASCTFSPANGSTLSDDTLSAVTITYNSLSTTQSITVSNPIYGVEWDGTSTSIWSRTDQAENFIDPQPYYEGMSETPSSPFDNIMPWSGMEIVDDLVAGKLVKIPKYWFKWTRNGSKMKLQISPVERSETGWHVSPAHADRGDGVGERDNVFVGRYHCANTTYKSASGVKPRISMTRAQFRTAIHNLGSSYWQFDFAMYWTIMMLYLVEYADWDSQSKLGGGCSETQTSSGLFNMGGTDSMPYHSGTTASSFSRYGINQYRYIEGLWANCTDWCDGIYFSSRSIYCIKNPANYSDTSGGTLVGTRANADGVATAWTNPSENGFEYALFPSDCTNDETYSTYDCDTCEYVNSANILAVGATYDQSWQGKKNGAFHLVGEYDASTTTSAGGSRLQKLP